MDETITESSVPTEAPETEVPVPASTSTATATATATAIGQAESEAEEARKLEEIKQSPERMLNAIGKILDFYLSLQHYRRYLEQEDPTLALSNVRLQLSRMPDLLLDWLTSLVVRGAEVAGDNDNDNVSPTGRGTTSPVYETGVEAPPRVATIKHLEHYEDHALQMFIIFSNPRPTDAALGEAFRKLSQGVQNLIRLYKLPEGDSVPTFFDAVTEDTTDTTDEGGESVQENFIARVTQQLIVLTQLDELGSAYAKLFQERAQWLFDE